MRDSRMNLNGEREGSGCELYHELFSYPNEDSDTHLKR
jgi:hypothetical protein